MKFRSIVLAVALISLGACKSHLNIANIHTEKNIVIDNQVSEDAKIKAFIEPYKNEMDAKMNTKISHTSVDLTKDGDNSNLGNLLADFTYEGALDWAKKNNIPHLDGGVINIGGIRSVIGAGDITTKQVFEVMPFENEVVIIKLKGKDLQGLFDYYAENQKNNPVSHLLVETDKNKITKQLVNGKAIDFDKDYYIVTSDYLAFGGDRMYFFTKGELIPTGIKLRELFLEKFRAMPEVVVPSDVRLIFKK
ncbi:5'-nucleotidase C-terminal domain-containing protein [Chryseobacterium sp. T1]